jgi:ELWxxDGT repeat protein
MMLKHVSALALILITFAAVDAHAAPYLVRDIGNGTADSWPVPIGEANGKLLFTTFGAWTFSNTRHAELWSTDGTAEGTRSLAAWEFESGAWIAGVVSTGDRLLFVVQGPGGRALWASDGTPDGTVVLTDLTHGAGSVYPSPVVLGGRALLAVADPEHGTELWVSDGTPDGTHVVADVAPGSASSNPTALTVRGDVVLYAATDADGGRELWRSDGTAEGTTRVADLVPGAASSDPSDFTVVDGQLCFIAIGSSGGRELWVTDGTAPGTAQLSDVGAADPAVQVWTTVGVAGALYFTTGTGEWNGTQSLWTSDGTPSGTILLASLPGQIVDGPVAAGDRMFFTVLGSEDLAATLWVSDGTPAGTLPLPAVAPPVSGDAAEDFALTAVANRVFFAACVWFHPCQLWRSDGTAAGTAVVTDFDPGKMKTSDDETHGNPPWLVNVNDHLLYATTNGEGTRELWTSDGTPEGTVPVIVDGHVPSPTTYAKPFGSTLLFDASDPETGVELWRTDGTAAGTSRVADINPGILPSYPSTFFEVGGQMFFSADDHATGRELWKTDGTAAGTVRVLDSDTDGVGSDPVELTPIADTLFFSASDLAGGLGLWRTDGTEAGTVRVDAVFDASPARWLTAVDAMLFFVADGPPPMGTGLWKSDGTAAGTGRLADLAPASGTIEVRALANVDGKLFLLARGYGQTTLWTSDGTPGGTMPVVQLEHPAYTTCYCAEGRTPLASIGGRAIFSTPTTEGCDAVWGSDGTAEGTVVVQELCGVCSECLPTAVVDDTLYFATFGWPYTKLFATDGTPASVRQSASTRWPFRMLAAAARSVFFPIDNTLWRARGFGDATAIGDIATHAGHITDLVGAGRRAFLVTDASWSSARLWRSDGTSSGTIPVAFVPLYVPNSLVGFDGLALFKSRRFAEGQVGEELWMSDGTSSGTRHVADMEPGSLATSPPEVIRVGDRVFFSATDKVHGRQLWALPLCTDGVPCPASPTCEPTECDDSNPCTVDGCSSDGLCEHMARPECQAAPSTTTTTLPSRRDDEPSGDGASQPDVPSSCASCTDDDPCTTDRCAPEGCIHEPLGGLAGVQCRFAGGRLRLAACRGDKLPRGLERRLVRALGRIDRARGTGLRATLKKAAKRVAAARRRPRRLSPGCAAALAGMIDDARALVAP